MSTLIKWEEPQAVIDIEWQNEYAPQIKLLRRTCVVATLILSVPTLFVIFFWASFALSITVLGLISTGLIFPYGLSLMIWPYKFGRRCQIGDKVLSKSYGPDNYYLSGYQGRPFKWAEIQGFEFVDHPDLPKIRRLVFSLKAPRSDKSFNRHIWRVVNFNYSPDEVSEQRLQTILSEHITSNELHH